MTIGSVTDKALMVGAPVGAVTSPWWFDHLNAVSGTTVLVCAAGVALIRLWIAIRDLRHKE